MSRPKRELGVFAQPSPAMEQEIQQEVDYGRSASRSRSPTSVLSGDDPLPDSPQQRDEGDGQGDEPGQEGSATEAPTAPYDADADLGNEN